MPTSELEREEGGALGVTERKLQLGGFGLNREGQGNEFRGKGDRRGVVLKLMKGDGMVGTFGRCGRGE